MNEWNARKNIYFNPTKLVVEGKRKPSVPTAHAQTVSSNIPLGFSGSTFTTQDNRFHSLILSD